MRESFSWFGILRRLLSPEIVWIVWWGLWIMGAVNTWWFGTSKWALYIWFVLIVVISIVYSSSWSVRAFYLPVGVNSLLMIFAIYSFQLYYYFYMPQLFFIEDAITLSVGIASPILIPVAYLWRLSQVFKNRYGND